jgi:hypothetical protein
MAAVNLATVTTITRIPLYRGQPTTSVTTLYTVPGSTNAKIESIIAANTTTTPATLTLYAVPSGGTAGTTNILVPGVSVPGSSLFLIDTPSYLDAGDFIAGLQGTASALTLLISGETYA